MFSDSGLYLHNITERTRREAVEAARSHEIHSISFVSRMRVVLSAFAIAFLFATAPNLTSGVEAAGARTSIGPATMSCMRFGGFFQISTALPPSYSYPQQVAFLIVQPLQAQPGGAYQAMSPIVFGTKSYVQQWSNTSSTWQYPDTGATTNWVNLTLANSTSPRWYKFKFFVVFADGTTLSRFSTNELYC